MKKMNMALSRQTTFDKVCADLSAILTMDTKADLADVKEILNGLNSVNERDFAKAVVDNAIEKTAKGKKKSTE